MSILPSYMSEAWICYEQMSREDLSVINPELVNVSPELCHEKVLPFLAWEANVDISAFSQQVSRSVIRASINAMQYAGTQKAVLEIIESLSDTTILEEWFTYEAPAYHFRTTLNTADMSLRLSEQYLKRIIEEVNIRKNARSFFDGMSVNFKNMKGDIFVSGAGTYSCDLGNEEIGDSDSSLEISLFGGCSSNVSLSNNIGVFNSITNINLSGAGIWTI